MNPYEYATNFFCQEEDRTCTKWLNVNINFTFPPYSQFTGQTIGFPLSFDEYKCCQITNIPSAIIVNNQKFSVQGLQFVNNYMYLGLFPPTPVISLGNATIRYSSKPPPIIQQFTMCAYNNVSVTPPGCFDIDINNRMILYENSAKLTAWVGSTIHTNTLNATGEIYQINIVDNLFSRTWIRAFTNNPAALSTHQKTTVTITNSVCQNNSPAPFLLDPPDDSEWPPNS